MGEQGWDEIERRSGLAADEMRQAAATYAKAEKVMGLYGMGVTQHAHGTQSVQIIFNFLMLRGNIGKLGAGICTIRGHSTV